MPDVPTVLVAAQRAAVRHGRLCAPRSTPHCGTPACRWCGCIQPRQSAPAPQRPV